MKTGFFTKNRIIAGVVILVVILLSAGGAYAAITWQKINTDPMSLFNQTAAPLPTETQAATTDGNATATPGGSATGGESAAPSATPNPEDVLKGQQDPSILKDTLNILLIGTDYADERIKDPQYARAGKDDFNSDVMIVLAINFKQNKVTMISCQRDTYAKIANTYGIYKLNSALSRGGGMNDKGYMNVCKSVQYLLDDKGRIPINYYIAGSIPAVKELTDMVGGIDFNVDIHFKIDGREYQKGMQHLTGQGVLDYCRVRKDDGTGFIDGPEGDLPRTGRQRAILMAVFEKLKSNADWLNAPNYLMKMQGKVATNLNLPQLAAITLWAKNLNMSDITATVMPGQSGDYPSDQQFGWSFVLVNQSKRVQLLKSVYGISADPEYKYDVNYAKVLWAYLEAQAWTKNITKVLDQDDALGADRKIDPTQVALMRDTVKQTEDMMKQYSDKLYNSNKPVFSADEVNEFKKQVYLLHNPVYNKNDPGTGTLADTLFPAAGYKIDWSLESLKMVPAQNK